MMNSKLGKYKILFFAGTIIIPPGVRCSYLFGFPEIVLYIDRSLAATILFTVSVVEGNRIQDGLIIVSPYWDSFLCSFFLYIVSAYLSGVGRPLE